DLITTGIIVVEVSGPAEQVTNVLKTTDGVDQVITERRDDGLVRFEVRARNDKDLREPIAQRITRNGWTIRQLDLRRRKVEEHFLDIVSASDPLQDNEAALAGAR